MRARQFDASRQKSQHSAYQYFLEGVFVETDRMTGLALRCEPVRVGGRLIPTAPLV